MDFRSLGELKKEVRVSHPDQMQVPDFKNLVEHLEKILGIKDLSTLEVMYLGKRFKLKKGNKTITDQVIDGLHTRTSTTLLGKFFKKYQIAGRPSSFEELGALKNIPLEICTNRPDLWRPALIEMVEGEFSPSAQTRSTYTWFKTGRVSKSFLIKKLEESLPKDFRVLSGPSSYKLLPYRQKGAPNLLFTKILTIETASPKKGRQKFLKVELKNYVGDRFGLLVDIAMVTAVDKETSAVGFLITEPFDFIKKIKNLLEYIKEKERV